MAEEEQFVAYVFPIRTFFETTTFTETHAVILPYYTASFLGQYDSVIIDVSNVKISQNAVTIFYDRLCQLFGYKVMGRVDFVGNDKIKKPYIPVYFDYYKDGTFLS